MSEGADSGGVNLTKEEAAELAAYIESAQGGSADIPQSPKAESIFRFFRHLLGLKDSSKVGNVSEFELGHLRLPVRAYQDIAHFCRLRGVSTWADWASGKGEIILATSLSKKGFLPQLFVTQIKREQKSFGSKVVEKGLFGRKKVVEEAGDDVG